MDEPQVALAPGTAIITHKTLDSIAGLLVAHSYLSARKGSTRGVIKGFVPGHGGDIYFVAHDDDATMAVYGWHEMELVESEQEPVKPSIDTRHTVPMSPMVATREEGERVYQDMFQRMALSWAATFGQEPAKDGALSDILRTTAYAIADEARRMIDVRFVIKLGYSVNLPDANHVYLRDWSDTELFLARRDSALEAIARAPTLYLDGKVPVLTDDVWIGKRHFSVKDRSTKLNSERVTIRVSLGRDFEAGQLDEVLAELVSDGWTISEGGES